jgi:hypothetical protein
LLLGLVVEFGAMQKKFGNEFYFLLAILKYCKGKTGNPSSGFFTLDVAAPEKICV